MRVCTSRIIPSLFVFIFQKPQNALREIHKTTVSGFLYFTHLDNTFNVYATLYMNIFIFIKRYEN